MEPSTVESKPKVQEGKGRRGTLENPEVYENVPGHMIPIIEREFDDFDTEAKKFLDGQTPEDQFIGFRLKQGVYGQRQAAVQMIRVKVRIGGGTSIMPRVAPTLYDFVEADNGDYLKVTEAALRIFDRQDWLRVNRMRARIKVLVDKIGMDAFREMVEEELRGDWVNERDFSIDHLLYVHDEEANAPAVPESYGSPNGDRSEFDAFLAENVQPQRQEGFVTIAVK